VLVDLSANLAVKHTGRVLQLILRVPACRLTKTGADVARSCGNGFSLRSCIRTCLSAFIPFGIRHLVSLAGQQAEAVSDALLTLLSAAIVETDELESDPMCRR